MAAGDQGEPDGADEGAAIRLSLGASRCEGPQDAEAPRVVHVLMKRTASAPSDVWGGAHKWFMGIVTTIAAVLTLLLNAKNLGLSSFLGLIDPSIVDRAARRVVLLPRADTLRALGDSASIVATVTDARGSTLVGATVRWKSSDSTVAFVDSTGTIVARAPGRAVIEASVREIIASAPVLVRPLPVEVLILGDSSVRMADGDSLRFAAYAIDARRHPVRGLVPEWQAADSQVVRVGTDGVVSALRAGRTMVTARVGDLSARVPVEVILTPASIALQSGGAQRGLAGRALTAPVVLQVLTRAGQPVPGTAVALDTENGEGTVSPASATTDAQGRVRGQWTLGSRAGQQRVFARVTTIDSALVVVADADPGPRNARVEVLTPELRGTAGGAAGGAADQVVRVRVTDTLGIALAAVRVAWTALENGKVEGVARTDSAGQAEATWTLGRRAGSQRLLVQVGNARYVPATTVRATAEPGAPREIKLHAGSGQSAMAGKALARPVVVVVRDSLGNPIAGAAVRAIASAGVVTDTLVTTGADGRAAFKWTLGKKAGAQKLDLRVAASALRLSVPATARAAAR